MTLGLGLSGDEFQKQADQNAAQAYALTGVTIYMDGADVRYGAIWVK